MGSGKNAIATGLSPRVRGNPLRHGWNRTRKGSIPASAGVPQKYAEKLFFWNRDGGNPHGQRQERQPVYPRECGATRCAMGGTGRGRGLSPRVRAFLQRELWKAIQKARRKGMSLRAIERDLGIHRGTVRKYLDSMGPPPRRPRAGPTTSAPDTIAP